MSNSHRLQETSRKAYYEEVLPNMSKMRKQIMLELFKDGPLTNRELSVRTGMETATVSGQVRPLLDDGLIHAAGKRECSETGNNARVVDLGESIESVIQDLVNKN